MNQAASTLHKYLHTGIITLAISGAAAIYLNFEGAKCLTALSGSETIPGQRTLEQVAEYCFVITNSYVYSLFGVAAGVIMVSIWAFKRGKNPDVRE